jgi:hypothetical protein
MPIRGAAHLITYYDALNKVNAVAGTTSAVIGLTRASVGYLKAPPLFVGCVYIDVL